MKCAAGVVIATIGVVPLAAVEARADTTWLPGAARGIPRATSASRDAPVFEYAFGPRAQVSIGAEPGIVEIRRPATTFRIGFHALVGLENATSNRVSPPTELWRGMVGASLALALPRLAGARLGPGSEIEVALVVGSESDHASSGSSSTLSPPGPRAIPFGGGGDFLALDAAVSLPAAGAMAIVVRLQDRIYFNQLPLIVGDRVVSDIVTDGLREGLVNAPAVDLVVRWQAKPWLAPQLSVFAEYLFPHDPFVADGQFLRAMAGVVMSGRIGEIEPFASFDGGNGKGLLVQERALRFSAGVRYAPF
jgi:hypothetical protein